MQYNALHSYPEEGQRLIPVLARHETDGKMVASPVQPCSGQQGLARERESNSCNQERGGQRWVWTVKAWYPSMASSRYLNW